MDNKRWYNRFATIFWWSLTILPLIIALIYFIGYHLTFNSGITTAQELITYHASSEGEFGHYLDIVLIDANSLDFEGMCLPFINNMFHDVFGLLDIDYFSALSVLFGWMVSVQFYHLIFDFIVWLPQWFHRIMEKGMDKLS